MRFARFAPLFLIVANCKHPPATSGAPEPPPSASVVAAPEADAGPPAKRRAQAPIEDGPSAASLATMRASFRPAAAAEATDPARAITLYDAAFAAVPSLAAMLGEARAAKAKGDEALARRSLARALAFAERTTDKPRVRVSVSVDHDGTPRVLDVENDAALLAMDDDALLARLDFATGALTPIVGLPGSPTIYAASPHLAVVHALGRTSVLELGVDDAITAEPLADVPYVRAGAISRDETLLGLAADSSVVVVDARTKKTLGKVTLPSEPLAVVGFTKSGKRLVVTLSDRVCVVSAPAWNACAPSPLLRGVAWPGLTAVGGELVAFTPNDTTFRVFDTEVGRPIVSLTGHFASVSSLALTPDGATLISSSFSRTVAWDVATHARSQLDTDSTESHSFEPRFSPDGKHAVETTSNGALVRDVSAMSVWTPLVSAGWSPLSATQPIVTFPAADHLWIGGNHFVAALDLGTKKLRSYPIYGRVAALSVAADESRFAVVDAYGNMGSNLYAYDASGKRLLSTYGGTMIGGVRIDGDHVLVNSVANVDTVDIATGSRTTGLLAAGPWPGSTATSPDKKLHVTANGDGTLTVTGFKGGGASIEIGADAWAATQNGKTAVFGNRASARCNVGAAWLPLDACAALLGAVSL